MLKKPLGNSLPLMDKWLENSVKRRKALDNTLQSITSLPYDEATIICGNDFIFVNSFIWEKSGNVVA